ncbi:MAG: DUF1697 domain-containing protein [Ktedonobacteraceae bacterium]
MTAFVSLLRGINVGGNRSVKMTDLKALYEVLGLRHVVTYIQSGNVVFTSDDLDTTQLQGDIEKAFEEKIGFHVHVLVRSSSELHAIIAKTPFQGQQGKESKWIAVMFLATSPDSAAQEALLTSYEGPEEIFIFGKEVYLYYPEGIGRSKLSHSFIEKKLRTVGTARNWNTILKLHELLHL